MATDKAIVNFRWSPDLVAAVDAAAKAAGLTRTKWVEQTLRNATGASSETASETASSTKHKLPPDSIMESQCPHPWSMYRRVENRLYCSGCRKYVVEEVT